MGGTELRGQVTPDQLSEAERRLYELARTSTPLAEIGVRLGLPVPEVDRRIELLLARLGVPDRLALREPLPEPVSEDGVEDAGADELEPMTGGRTVSRRSLLVGGALTGLAALGGAGAAVLLTRGDGDKPPAEAGTTTTPEPTPVISPGAGLDLIEPVDNAFERRTFAPGEEIDWAHGIFFMNVDTGEVEGWRLSSGDPNTGLLGSYSLPTPGFIQGQGDEGRAYYLTQRETDKAWRYPVDRLRLVTGSHQALLFEEMEPANGPPVVGTGRFHVTDAGLSGTAAFESTPIRFAPDPLISRDGALLVAVTALGEQFAVEQFELATGQRIHQLPLPLATSATVNIRWHHELNSSSDFAVEFRLAADPDFGVRTLRVRLPWRGAWPTAVVEGLGHDRNLLYSPDGRFELVSHSLRTVPATGVGGGELWPALEIREFGNRVARILSATTAYGDAIPGRRFTAPMGIGSGPTYFFTQTASNATEGPGWDRVKYSLWQPGSPVEYPLELPPPIGGQWYHHAHYRGPIPHPTNPLLVALGRLEVARLFPAANVARVGVLQDLVQANVTSEPGPDHIDPWCGNADELVFVNGHGGHDGGFPHAMIAPSVEEPPYDDSFRFVVARAGDCVNLRAAPSLDAEVRDCLVDGTPVTLWEDAVGGPEPGMAFVRNEEGAWVAVRLENGNTGWVSSAYLDWA